MARKGKTTGVRGKDGPLARSDGGSQPIDSAGVLERYSSGASAQRGFPIVGLGASAGGVDAVSQLLARLAEPTGMAFIVIQHLAPRQPSLLRETLARSTRMTVVDAANEMLAEPDHVYVIPPGMEMSLRGRQLVVAPRQSPTMHNSIDVFFRALALEQRNRAVGVLLSGTGSDGTEGLRAIRAEGGIALVEEPRSARFPAMPESAIAAGAVDHVLTIEELARELVHLSRQAYLVSTDALLSGEDAEPEQDELLQRVLERVRASSGVDFSEYKTTTIRRRIARRMLLRRSETVSDYLALLEVDSDETGALCRDILIHVTGFFRDKAAYAALEGLVIPKLLEQHADGSSIRIWVPGCSTGEEPYSIAISVLEALGSDAARVPVQIFGTDLSSEMIDRARSGFYRDSAVTAVTPERLERFFVRADGGYRVGKLVRERCVFVRHDLVRDPPFSRLDLISCRNVLIYFGPLLQKRVVPLFHYCLRTGGFLLLGHAESVVGFTELFTPADKSSRLFSRREAPQRVSLPSPLLAGAGPPRAPALVGGVGPAALTTLQKRADDILVGRYAPPGALVDGTMQVIHLRGRTSPYLELQPGHPDLHLLKLAREELVPVLRWAVQKAKREIGPVRREGIELRDDYGVRRVNVEVIPVSDLPSGEPCFLVLFEGAGSADAPPPVRPLPAEAVADGHEREIAFLREEAAAAGEYLQSLLDERQRMNDDLTSSNEELVASNEELQSTNEELEAAKEELQSSNEELTTVNDELQLRHQEINQVNSDLVNVLASVDIPIVIVGGDRKVRRFTPQARALMHLIPSDVGRPLDEIKLNIDQGDLDRLVSEVLDTLTPRELEVRDREERWHRLRIRPYRTVDGRLDGAVLSLTDIDRLKRTAGDATAALDLLAAIMETMCMPVVVLDDSLRLRSANRAFSTVFGEVAGEAVGTGFFALGGGRWNVPELRTALDGLLAEGGDRALEIEIEAPAGRRRSVAVAASTLRWHGDPPLVLLTPVDVTDRARLLAAAEEARAEAVRANRTKDVFLATTSHELRAPLHAITLQADLLLDGAAADAEQALRAAERIALAARAQERIISDLLDVSAIVAGKISLQRQPVDLSAVVAAAIDGIRGAAERKGIRLTSQLGASVGRFVGDANRLRQIVANLLTNAVKFTPAGGEVTLALERRGGQARITVSDTGEGIAPDFLPHVFDRFEQADSSRARNHDGLGLGLAIVRDLVWLHHGTVRAESGGAGKGATFTVDLPLADDELPDRRPDEVGDSIDTNPFGYELDRPAGAAAHARPDGNLEGIRVLVVDDDQSSREVLVDILRLRMADVMAVESAEQALHALASFRPDVILCDIAMPGEDGYSLIRRIRALAPEQGGRVPAVALTALATETDQGLALEAGFDHHIAKPSPAAILCEMVRQLVGPPPNAPALD
ncbi:MAG TPA: chemotaxis protein CheB [Kofleriaceae bacterium]|nr:chemotaxis protein CheB [Kofleriaceae bacterium]